MFPESANLADYKVIVVPPLYVASDALLTKLINYARNGGHLVMSFKSGFTNEYDTVRWSRMPGVPREAAGFSDQEFSNLKQPLAYYDHPFFGKYPAITRNRFGKGTLTYEGTCLSDQHQEKVLQDILEVASLAGADQQLPKPVHVEHGTSPAGIRMHYFLNYSGEAQTFAYAYGADVLTGRTYARSAGVTLPAWDLAIIEER